VECLLRSTGVEEPASRQQRLFPQSPMVDQGRMMPVSDFHWLRSLFSVAFSDRTLLVSDRKSIRSAVTGLPVPIVSKCSLSEYEARELMRQRQSLFTCKTATKTRGGFITNQTNSVIFLASVMTLTSLSVYYQLDKP